MKSMRRGLAVLLAVLLMLPTLPAQAVGAELPAIEADGEVISNEVLDENSDIAFSADDAEVDVDSEGAEIEAETPDDEVSVEDADSGNEAEAGDSNAEVSDGDVEDGADDAQVSEEGAEAVDAEMPADQEEEGSETADAEVPGDQESEGTEAIDAETAGDQESEESDAADADNATDQESEASEDGEDVADTDASDAEETDEEPAPEEVPEFGIAGVVFSTGGEYQLVVNPSASENEENEGYTGIFEADGSYTIQIPEEDPFFPYEVQFVDMESGEVQNQWFMTPASTVEFGGHTFRVAANFTGNVVTQFSLNIAGDIVVVYPAEKQFGGVAPMSLLPLKEQRLGNIDLTGYTPLDLTMVSVASMFTGDVELKDTDSVVWTTRYSSYYSGSSDVPDYTVNQKGDYINLAYASSVQMIVGEPDQLAADNIRYTAYLNKSNYDEWLNPVFYTQDETGARTAVKINREYYGNSYDMVHGSRYEYGYERITLTSTQGYISDGYLGLTVNAEDYAKKKFTSVRAYEGRHETAAEAMGATEITDQIFAKDMAQANAGYYVERYYDTEITLVSFDAQGNVVGCLPVEIWYSSSQHGIYVDWMRNTAGNNITSTYDTSYDQEGNQYRVQKLYTGNPANGMYIQSFIYYNDGTVDNSVITAAYVGSYSSIAEATAAGVENIKDTLFRPDSYEYYSRGYKADYSNGVWFTIFIGEDGTEGQQVFRYNIKAEEREAVISTPTLSGYTIVDFYGLYDVGNMTDYGYAPYVSNVKLQDSYAENNYVTYVVNDDVDRSKLALDFNTPTGLKLYAAGSSTPVESEKTPFDFSKGLVQFTSSAENGTNAMNYWIQVITKSETNGQLFMNSLIDESAKTRTEGGITYTTREVMLDSIHNYKHDIMLANMGTEAIEGLSAELASDVLELDEYWTLTGKHELSGFTTADKNTSYGVLPNLAMLRLKEKEGVENGTEITGTLTLKSGAATLMVITLTGTVGDPTITTKEIPEAVKYVPYGTMIQNSNKYSWNTVTYSLVGEGNLPAGMILRPNGEVYGVPTEVGEFTFTVRMRNSYSSFGSSTRTFTLVVKENTDENVDSQTDENYELTDRVTYDYNIGMGDQLMVSQGEYGEFIDLWLDGEKLTPGVDYTSESGSTRITILAQTLTTNKSEGTHTLGMEFRAADQTLKRAAQNYVLGGKSSFDDNGGSSSNEGNNNNSSNNSSSNNSSSSKGSRDVVVETTSTTYTVVKGDTLWKIAVKFYGNGNMWRRIYEDNKDVLRDPNKLRIGQVLTIIVTTTTGSQDTAPGVAEDGTYTVQRGDSLWKIAAKVYGNGRNWRKIYEANTDKISDASKIRVGQVIVIPE